ncbi:ankyrin repeat domain-containing protein 22-like protein [Lates japonicus]|uniref:Ankyrin repeat domain-containing protein 22-like protein n=1 Tax=Lates japonicus TaxID=270547 RepID=A0AAD3NB79_LATJO|nr:ankyrin repeat domain-containing protein 22-like protein [Lates japonicus]
MGPDPGLNRTVVEFQGKDTVMRIRVQQRETQAQVTEICVKQQTHLRDHQQCFRKAVEPGSVCLMIGLGTESSLVYSLTLTIGCSTLIWMVCEVFTLLTQSSSSGNPRLQVGGHRLPSGPENLLPTRERLRVQVYLCLVSADLQPAAKRCPVMFSLIFVTLLLFGRNQNGLPACQSAYDGDVHQLYHILRNDPKIEKYNGTRPSSLPAVTNGGWSNTCWTTTTLHLTNKVLSPDVTATELAHLFQI